MKITVTKKAAAKFKKGYPLIQMEDLVKEQLPLTTEWVTLVTGDQQFVAQGYLGEQNKGIGWLVSWKEEPLNQAYFESLFLQAKESRNHYFQQSGTTAFRLFNGEGDGLGGLTIDYYAGYVVFSWYNATLYAKQELLLAAFQTCFPEIQGGYEKIRFKNADLPESQPIFGSHAPEPLMIQENFVQYATYLDEGLMTGIFLDQKEVRGALIDGLTMGESVLNMFSYTGAFSVAAAMGGARNTVSVDLAKRSLQKTQEQFEVNQLPLDNQKIIVMDVFDYFRYAARKGFYYDTIILDPPSFARNKKKVFTVAKNYGELVANSIDILAGKGRIIASTNAANVSVHKFQEMIEQACQEKAVSYQKVGFFQLPADFAVNPAFPEGNYLKVFIYEIQK